MKLSSLQQYTVVTANYWAFTLTDGALRILVVGHFHELGYSTLQIALLFLFYEFFGIITNLFDAKAEGEKINEIEEEKMRAFLKMLITTLRVKTSYLYHPTKQEKLKIKKYIKLF